MYGQVIIAADGVNQVESSDEGGWATDKEKLWSGVEKKSDRQEQGTTFEDG
jgi:hypothetical protein